MKLFIRVALILAGSAAFAACLSAQTPGGAVAAPPAPAAFSADGLGPRIQFNTENYNAGTNLAGDPIRYSFTVINTGDETLVLSNVIPNCGCTTVGGTAPGSAGAWTREIAPGQTGVIPIQVVTSNLRGQIAKTVKVISNDRTRPNATLQITGVVWLPIEVSPQPTAYFSLMPDSTNQNTQVLRIFNRMETPLSLSDPQSTTNAFSAVLKTNVPGREFELAISAAPLAHLPASLSTTIVQGEISLKSSATNRNPLTIPVFETIAPEITVFPPNIPLPAGPLTQPSTSHVTIRDNIANFTLSDPAANVPGVKVSMTMMQTNRIYVLTVVFPQGFAAQPGQNVVLTVKTDNPRFPEITIPVTLAPGVALPIPPPQVLTPPADAAAVWLARPPAPVPAMPPDPAMRIVLLPPAALASSAAPANATNAPPP
jgi:hypothetical protein